MQIFVEHSRNPWDLLVRRVVIGPSGYVLRLSMCLLVCPSVRLLVHTSVRPLYTWIVLKRVQSRAGRAGLSARGSVRSRAEACGANRNRSEFIGIHRKLSESSGRGNVWKESWRCFEVSQGPYGIWGIVESRGGERADTVGIMWGYRWNRRGTVG